MREGKRKSTASHRIASSHEAHRLAITKAHRFCDAPYGDFKVGEFRALREYTHTLRLVSKLPDLRVGYANSAMRWASHRIASSLEAHGSPI